MFYIVIFVYAIPCKSSSSDGRQLPARSTQNARDLARDWP